MTMVILGESSDLIQYQQVRQNVVLANTASPENDSTALEKVDTGRCGLTYRFPPSLNIRQRILELPLLDLNVQVFHPASPFTWGFQRILPTAYFSYG